MDKYYDYKLVQVRVDGNQSNDLIQSIARDGHPIKDLKQINNEQFSLRVTPQTYFEMKRRRHTYSCRLKLIHRPRLLKGKQFKHFGIPVIIGVCLTFILILLLSNIIWRVEVIGGSQELRYDVTETLNELGLKRGNWMQQKETLSNIEREVMNRIDELSYIGINQQGTSFTITVEESETFEEPKSDEPVDLIASKTGVIQSMFVEVGKPVVNVQDTVNQGDLLVSGLLDEEGEVKVHAKGEILADVWYRVQVTSPLKQSYEMLTGDKETNYSLTLFDRFDLFSPTTDNLTYTTEQSLYFLNWELPITYKRHDHYTLQTETKEFEESEQLKEEIENQMKRQLDSDIDVVYQKVLHEERDSDKVKLDIFVKVHEDIAQKQIIDQGD
ncbi:sporulation protein YqfD [Alkalibacillus almallahensis]|uniref:sporulation protein YqfD n=1 Tax=Alkalibacillus almallahensis TaxID=1379154 RepID=UPI001423A31F|nr:sporulation protein YqfD [Alkalibacillus almallahensis]NIK13352.1 hypothetical protein [Alkalibacillus almallahensis]